SRLATCARVRGRCDFMREVVARPDRPRRCTLPITALRVTPPSRPAIWLALSPSAQSFFKSSTRSSFQAMPWFSRCATAEWHTLARIPAYSGQTWKDLRGAHERPRTPLARSADDQRETGDDAGLETRRVLLAD